ncbi:MAG: hypothetical protein SFW66_00205 [Gammaproteobacteria bacterium]|nr:hypothetical protein [Gammaproteobacteria bacterium]
MKHTISINFDLDKTIFSRGSFGSSWNGGKRLWINLCKKLVKLGEKHNVKIVFGIITAKNGLDDIVEEAILNLRGSLLNQAT